MHVFCNGERVRVDGHLLADVVRALGFDQQAGGPERRVVVAVNETFVAKADWASYQVRAEDRLDILSAMQGG